jgi:hypothetical protein
MKEIKENKRKTLMPRWGERERKQWTRNRRIDGTFTSPREATC